LEILLRREEKASGLFLCCPLEVLAIREVEEGHLAVSLFQFRNYPSGGEDLVVRVRQDKKNPGMIGKGKEGEGT
jgi:hypothetical protein